MYNHIEIGITGIYKTDEDTAWLAWFGILPEHRRIGYREKLLKITMELAKTQNFKFFRLYTDMLENNNAVKLYEKVGFIGEKYTKEESLKILKLYEEELR